jgi:hypothetical protein
MNRSPSVCRAISSAAATLAAMAWTLGAGCAGDVAEPYQLDHARILAVRTEPAQLGPGARATLDALFTDSTATPRLATADELTVALPPELDRPELRALLSTTPEGVRLQAPDAGTLAQLRAALAVPEGELLRLPLTVRVRSADGVLHAQKLVAFGATLANPPPPTVAVDGATVAPGAEAVLSASRETSLEVTTGDELSAVRWFSSTGALRRYTQPTAWFSADDDDAADSAGPGASPGHLAVVLRTAAGGVSWRVLVTKLAR